jgi:hypothetical protein
MAGEIEAEKKKQETQAKREMYSLRPSLPLHVSS